MKLEGCEGEGIFLFLCLFLTIQIYLIGIKLIFLKLNLFCPW